MYPIVPSPPRLCRPIVWYDSSTLNLLLFCRSRMHPDESTFLTPFTMSITFVLVILQLFTATIAAPSFLNLTAISAANGESTLECWQLSDPFTLSNQAGTAGTAIKQLGNVANATLTILPAKFNGGAHRAPAVQYVFPPFRGVI